MILFNGTLFETKEQNRLLDELPSKLTDTLLHQTLDRENVIRAFDNISQRLAAGEFESLLQSVDPDSASLYMDQIVRMMSRDYLQKKTEIEFHGVRNDNEKIQTQEVPLGVIFHIAAGNMDVLPIASIGEGLLAGNINILKLPSVDRGLTIQALKMLVDAEPALKDFIYVFDTPSSDIAAMKKLADLSDGIAIWGGDEVVHAVRAFAKPGTRLIEWGHKLGFAYISGYENEETELTELAEHILMTRQLLCSSCQVIYIDTDKYDEALSFAGRFLPYLERAFEKHPIREIGGVAELTLRRYEERIEKHLHGDEASEDKRSRFQGQHTSVTVKKDPDLELSYMYGNVIVKPLPAKNLADVLRKSKGYLQTAGLICSPEKRDALTLQLTRCGVQRVTRAGHMSSLFEGEAHDGEFALARYSRFINIEN
ncbi:MAG: acyl-CoA reductase [Clostridiales bacterium]|nr:acyl-CoA reductase [Clostridiales bacterium]